MPFIADGEIRDMKNMSSDAFPYLTTRKGRTPYTFDAFVPSAEGDAYKDVEALPDASEQELGNIYKKEGIFYECVFEDDVYSWKETVHPTVSKKFELSEFLKEQKGISIKKIIEVAGFLGKLAALFMAGDGTIKLYYDEKVWDVNNVTTEPGKKLSMVGNRLIVGESGSYLYIKDGVSTYTGSGGAFAVTIEAKYADYGNSGRYTKWSEVEGYADTGKATFEIWAPSFGGEGFKTVYEGLKNPGTDFSVKFNGKTYYLESESVEYDDNLEIYAWKSGGNWHYDYADRLYIKAKGVKEDFSWNNRGNGFSLNLEFQSTDPHYFDVVAWKKRLWGYKNNVLYGTAADIFDEDGQVDWNRGDNTYLEAISQPIWQGADITGLAALSDALILFKDDNLTVFTGNYPAVMSGNTISCRGLPDANRDSVAVGNEAVYYLSTDGVYRFSGGIPRCISRNAKIKGTEAVGISDGNKYYLSVKDNGKNYLYVYDANYDVWHIEDDINIQSFTILDGDIYAADETQIYNISKEQEPVEWEITLWFDEGTYKKKKYKEISLRGNVGKCELQIKCDEDEWRAIRWSEGKLHAKISPKLCEEFMIKIKGNGICCIKSLDRVFEVVE